MQILLLEMSLAKLLVPLRKGEYSIYIWLMESAISGQIKLGYSRGIRGHLFNRYILDLVLLSPVFCMDRMAILSLTLVYYNMKMS